MFCANNLHLHRRTCLFAANTLAAPLQEFSPSVAMLLGALAAFTNALKAYTGVGIPSPTTMK